MSIVLGAASQPSVPVSRHWRLNERHYGALTGLNKAETMERLGAEYTMGIRRGDTRPPAIDAQHAMWQHVTRGARLESLAESGELPTGESLDMCGERTARHWREQILPALLAAAKRPALVGGHARGVLVVSHMHTIRLLIAEIDGLDADALQKLDVATAVPLVYRVDAAHAERFFTERNGHRARSSRSSGEGVVVKKNAPRGRWLGEPELASMRLDAIRSLLLRRRGVLWELLPRLPDRVQQIFVRPAFPDEARRAALLALGSGCEDALKDDANPPLRATQQLAALQTLFATRPWITQVDETFCDAVARANHAVSDALTHSK